LEEEGREFEEEVGEYRRWAETWSKRY